MKTVSESSNQTVAGLKRINVSMVARWVASSNQTVAGLKLALQSVAPSVVSCSNQTVAGLKLRHHAGIRTCSGNVQIRPLRD